MKIVKELSLAGISLIALVTPAYAQSSEATESENAEDTSDAEVIIVNARRRDEALQDVPAVVNAVTAESINKLNIRKFEEVQALVPGYTVGTVKGSSGIVSTLRGIAFNSGASGGNATVEYYINDAVGFGGTVTTALFDIAQIDVLRGPQGTLRGRSTPSGSVNITTRAPNLSEVGAYANGTVNDIGGFNLSGAMNIPIIADKLAFRLAGSVAEDDGDEVRALTNSLNPFSESRAIRASLSADPFEGVLLLDFKYTNVYRNQTNYDHVESATQLGASPVLINAKDRLALTGLPLYQRIRYDIYNWQAQLNLMGQSLTYVGAKTKGSFSSNDALDDAGVYANDSAVNFTSSAAFQGYAAGRNFCQLGYAAPFCPPVATGAVVNYESLQTTFTDNTSHELRLQNEERVAGIFDYVVGGFLYNTKSDIPFTRRDGAGLGGTYAVFNPIAFPPTPANLRAPIAVRNDPAYLLGILTTNLYITQPTKEQSVFGNITAHIGEKTEISGGLRHIWYKSNFAQYFGTAPVGIPSITSVVDEGHTIYSASVKHNFTDDVMVYGSVGSSWRPSNPVISGFNVPLLTAKQREYLNVKAETSTSYEVGFKSYLFDKRLRLNATAFFQKFNNYPYRAAPVFFYNPGTLTVNSFNFASSVPVDVKGVEVDFGIDITPNWNIGGVVSYVDGKIKNGTIPCTDYNPRDGIADTGGQPTAAAVQAAYPVELIGSCTVSQNSNNTPKWNGTITSEYTNSISDNVDGYLRGLLSWSGKSQGDPVNIYDSVKSYGLLNLFLGFRDPDGAWEVSLFGKNVTNTFRVLTRTNGALATPGAPASVRTNYFGITATPPREFGINLRFAIGSR